MDKNKKKKLFGFKKVISDLLWITIIAPIYFAIKVNFPFTKDIGFDVLNIELQRNNIEQIISVALTTESASNVFLHLGAGLFGTIIMLGLFVGIWFFIKNYIVDNYLA